MVNCAGTNAIGHFWEIAHADWRRVLDVNLLAVTRAGQVVVPPMIAAGGGSIINIASVHACRPAAGEAAYSVSKAALVALTRAMAICRGEAPAELLTRIVPTRGSSSSRGSSC